MEVKLDDTGADIEVRWDIKDNEKLYLNTTLACYKSYTDELLFSGSLYMTMPIEIAEILLEKLTELVGKEI